MTPINGPQRNQIVLSDIRIENSFNSLSPWDAHVCGVNNIRFDSNSDLQPDDTKHFPRLLWLVIEQIFKNTSPLISLAMFLLSKIKLHLKSIFIMTFPSRKFETNYKKIGLNVSVAKWW